MKHTKKIASLLLALVMVFALATTAFAAGTNSITVNGAQKGETYEIYKMLDLIVNEDQTAYSYTVNSNWTNFFTNSGAGAAYVDIDTQGYVTWKEGKDTASDMETFAKDAAAFASANGLTSVVDAITPTDDGAIIFANLDSGYYLITSTNGTLAMVDTTPKKPAATVNEKNPDHTLDKRVQEDSTQAWGKENSAQIGDIVYFQVTITLHKGAKDVVMHDKMEDGLDFNAFAGVEIDGLTGGEEFTVEVDDEEDDCDFEIHFTQAYLDSLTGDTNLTVTYEAVLNENANITAGEKNDAKLTWGDASNTEWSETVTKTYQFQVLKYDANDETRAPLAGATFQLKDADGNVVYLKDTSPAGEPGTEYTVVPSPDDTGIDTFDLDVAVDRFTTVSDSEITIKGVDLDEYTLVEIEAPAGYNKLDQNKEFTVTADQTVVVEIPNNSGTELPSTGGIGTTIFYIFGSILVVGAAVLLITKKRMSVNG